MTTVEMHHGAATAAGLLREVTEDAFPAAPPRFVAEADDSGRERVTLEPKGGVRP